MDLGVVMECLGQGRIDEAGVDRIGPNVLKGVLDGSGLVEDADCAFGCVVGGGGSAAEGFKWPG